MKFNDVESLARAVAEYATTHSPSETMELAQTATDMLIEQKRTKDLRKFPKLVKRMLTRYGPHTVEIEVPSKLPEADLDKLRTLLIQKLNCAVVFDVRENPKLIGGIRLRIGDERFDYSLRGALDRIPTLFSTTV